MLRYKTNTQYYYPNSDYNYINIQLPDFSEILDINIKCDQYNDSSYNVIILYKYDDTNIENNKNFNIMILNDYSINNTENNYLNKNTIFLKSINKLRIIDSDITTMTNGILKNKHKEEMIYIFLESIPSILEERDIKIDSIVE